MSGAEREELILDQFAVFDPIANQDLPSTPEEWIDVHSWLTDYNITMSAGVIFRGNHEGRVNPREDLAMQLRLMFEACYGDDEKATLASQLRLEQSEFPEEIGGWTVKVVKMETT